MLGTALCGNGDGLVGEANAQTLLTIEFDIIEAVELVVFDECA
ncbi:hypothetical protein VIS19158_06084 [Vibrio scophthalmi LMG 19158]|uniref:Uncharacterized protein n=1 Tax=Vibrio scophthalmi LMG 19158 TaxID=870967 RepID=F9RL09_9VIBR|nr:hypothetical protein VIS19158_06084 [Vibrio scophthalmi LMG 19158]